MISAPYFVYVTNRFLRAKNLTDYYQTFWINVAVTWSSADSEASSSL